MSIRAVQLLLALLCTMAMLGLSPPTLAQSTISIDTSAIVICHFSTHQSNPPRFNEPNCTTQQLFNVNPQGQEIWFKGTISIAENYIQRQQPSALFVMGKMSSEVFFNGHRLGNNGTPSFDADSEFVGNMDARFYIPPQLIHAGANEVIIHASSHHGLLTLAAPIHFIGITEYASTNVFFQHNLLISLCLLGALLLGCTYLATLVIRSDNKKSILLILLMASFTSAQLFAEISRQLFNYSYPIHDVRLIVITLFALGFGLSFLAFSLDKFTATHQRRNFIVGTLATVIAITLIKSFDAKAAIAVLIPTVISLYLCTLNYVKTRSQQLLVYLAAFAAFTLTIIVTFTTFHSTMFYYIVTAMMTFLTIKKANELVAEKALRAIEEKQVLKLQFKLEQLQQQHTPHKLKIASSGKTELLPTQDILYCKAAGDYVEVYLHNKKQSLYSGALKSIEEQLPATFAKVHRSFIVNLDHVSAITTLNNTANSAILVLDSGDEIPISRRFLPQVRNMIKNLA